MGPGPQPDRAVVGPVADRGPGHRAVRARVHAGPGGREDPAAAHRERGLAQFECVPDESAYNPIGVVHGGLVCTLADSVAGCAVHTTLDAGIGYTSIDITVNYLRPVTVDSGTLVAVGRVTKPGRRVALAAAEIHDGAGRLVATASSNCLVFPL